MRTSRMLPILVLALGLMVWPAAVSGAEPMGTAFTYQGRLIDANEAADGQFDFQFKLYDAESDGNQVGGDINKPDIEVMGGYFTVALDFDDPNAFNGEGRWLQVGVRPGHLTDPNGYATLNPRQKVTPAPYALYAEAVAGDGDWAISGNDMYSIPSGNVGIRTTSATSALEVNGNINTTNPTDTIGGIQRQNLLDKTTNLDLSGRYFDFHWTGETVLSVYGTGDDVSIGGDLYFMRARGIKGGETAVVDTDQLGKVRFQGFDGDSYELSSEIRGVASSPIADGKVPGSLKFLTADGSGALRERMTVDSAGNVGIGTPNPGAKLEVSGHMKGSSLYVAGVATFDSDAFVADHLGIGPDSYPPQEALHVDGKVLIHQMDPAAAGQLVRWCGGGRLCQDSSSARYKEYIEAFEDDFSKILLANPKSFVCKTSGQKGIGFIAEEFDALGLRSLVHYKDGQPFGIMYEKVPLYLLEVTKQLAGEAKELRVENQSFRQRVEALEKMIVQLQFSRAKEVHE